MICTDDYLDRRCNQVLAGLRIVSSHVQKGGRLAARSKDGLYGRAEDNLAIPF
jgi:hypothetical protein